MSKQMNFRNWVRPNPIPEACMHLVVMKTPNNASANICEHRNMQFSFITRPFVVSNEMHPFPDNIGFCLPVHRKNHLMNGVKSESVVGEQLMYLAISVYKYIIIIHLFVYMALDNKSSKSIYSKYNTSSQLICDDQITATFVYSSCLLLDGLQTLLWLWCGFEANAHQRSIERQTIIFSHEKRDWNVHLMNIQILLILSN